MEIRNAPYWPPSELSIRNLIMIFFLSLDNKKPGMRPVLLIGSVTTAVC